MESPGNPGRFNPQSLEQNCRAVWVVMLVIAEMYIKGVSTREDAAAYSYPWPCRPVRPRRGGTRSRPAAWTRSGLVEVRFQDLGHAPETELPEGALECDQIHEGFSSWILRLMRFRYWVRSRVRGPT